MKKNKLDTIGYIDDQLVEKADKYNSVKKKNTWVKWGAMAACLCLVIAGVVTMFPKHYDTMTGDPILTGDPIKPGNADLEGNNSIPGAAHTENAITGNQTGEGSYVTAAHMIEIQVKKKQKYRPIKDEQT